MKLRNKKTGEIGNFCYGYTNELCVSWQKDDGFWEKQEYDSLAELNEDWEDYEEPEMFYVVEQRGMVGRRFRIGDEYEKMFKEIGNYFETREEAEKALEKLKAWKRLKDTITRIDRASFDDVGTATLFIRYKGKDHKKVSEELDLLFGGEE